MELNRHDTNLLPVLLTFWLRVFHWKQEQTSYRVRLFLTPFDRAQRIIDAILLNYFAK